MTDIRLDFSNPDSFADITASYRKKQGFPDDGRQYDNIKEVIL